MKISVIVLTYNHEDTIERCLQSIISQDWEHLEVEILVADDYSSYKIHEICSDVLEGFNWTLFERDSNIGLTMNLYEAMKKCTGEYVALIEGDDYWCDEKKIKKQISVMSKNIGLVYTNSYIKKKDKTFKRFLNNAEPTFFNIYVHKCQITTSSALFSKPALSEILNEVRIICITKKTLFIDLISWLSVANKYKVKKIDCFTTVYDSSNISLTNNQGMTRIHSFSREVFSVLKYFYTEINFFPIQKKLMATIFLLKRYMIVKLNYIKSLVK